MNPSFLTLTDLKHRGWTVAIIKRFLGDPDDTRENPHYRSGPPMKLYRWERVEQAEALPDYQAAQSARASKRAAAQKALATKQKKLDEYVDNLTINVPNLDQNQLIELACRSYNDHRPEWKTDDCFASTDSDPVFLARICVNYLRHCLTQYETHLDDITGKVGAREAYTQIKLQVLDEIANQYDWLQVECGRQVKRMREQESERP